MREMENERTKVLDIVSDGGRKRELKVSVEVRREVT